MTALRPNPDQFLELVSSTDDGPVVMLNLLKFAPTAADGSGSGQEAYGRYGDAVVTMIEATGGRIRWMGRADQILIGDPEETWDTVVLVEYPNRKAFLDMTSTPDYEKAHEHREAGLERTVVIACTPRFDALGG
jgi:uncharacterized protein (DUF1330 family)